MAPRGSRRRRWVSLDLSSIEDSPTQESITVDPAEPTSTPPQSTSYEQPIQNLDLFDRRQATTSSALRTINDPLDPASTTSAFSSTANAPEHTTASLLSSFDEPPIQDPFRQSNSSTSTSADVASNFESVQDSFRQSTSSIATSAAIGSNSNICRVPGLAASKFLVLTSKVIGSSLENSSIQDIPPSTFLVLTPKLRAPKFLILTAEVIYSCSDKLVRDSPQSNFLILTSEVFGGTFSRIPIQIYTPNEPQPVTLAGLVASSEAEMVLGRDEVLSDQDAHSDPDRQKDMEQQKNCRQQLKRVQKYVSRLPGYQYNTGQNIGRSPHPPTLFVSVDLKVYSCDERSITQIGISALRVFDDSHENDSHVIYSRHYRTIRPGSLPCGLLGDSGNPGDFPFVYGNSEWIASSDAPSTIKAALTNPLEERKLMISESLHDNTAHLRQLREELQMPPDTEVILITKDRVMSRRVLIAIGFDIEGIHDSIYLADVFMAATRDFQQRSLRTILSAIGVRPTGAKNEGLRNAGNRSRQILLCLFYLGNFCAFAPLSRQIWDDVFQYRLRKPGYRAQTLVWDQMEKWKNYERNEGDGDGMQDLKKEIVDLKVELESQRLKDSITASTTPYLGLPKSSRRNRKRAKRIKAPRFLALVLALFPRAEGNSAIGGEDDAQEGREDEPENLSNVEVPEISGQSGRNRAQEDASESEDYESTPENDSMLFQFARPRSRLGAYGPWPWSNRARPNFMQRGARWKNANRGGRGEDSLQHGRDEELPSFQDEYG